mmetsp:Transcript_8294/g.20970  ORF Transcript_8294/g.20970 Transcript_8294/m.20970 type:complete len:417 (+) Transcript_8294:61-1311(+)
MPTKRSILRRPACVTPAQGFHSVFLSVKGERCFVPLSQAVQYRPNPKQEGSNAWQRYQRYCKAKTVGEALKLGSLPDDFRFDYKQGFLTLPRFSRRFSVKSRAAAFGTGENATPTLSVHEALRDGVSGDIGSATPIAHALSLGSRCLVSRLLQDAGMRRYAGPFDWVYSSAEMVRHCLNDDFTAFLDRSDIIAAGKKFGHRRYGPMLKRGIIFPHHEPRGRDREFFMRTVARFRNILASSERKLFVLAHPVSSVTELQSLRHTSTKGCGIAEIARLYEDILSRGTRNFEFIAVYLLIGPAAAWVGKEGSRQPRVRPVRDTGPGSERLVMIELICTGGCTGVHFKAAADSKALRLLIIGDDGRRRRMDLKSDPLPPKGGGGLKRRRLGEVQGSDGEGATTTSLTRKPSGTILRRCVR